MLLFGCRKDDALLSIGHTTTEAYVIGFDPCTNGKALVLKLINSSDTVVTHNLPADLYTFSPTLFQGYMNDFLFPLPERARYKVRVEYYLTPAGQQVHSVCQGNVNLADFNRATKGKQIIITAAQRVN